MSQGSIKSNYIYNLLLTISSYIASLIVYPYVARVLGVENMGILGFVNKTIDSFMLFSLLGISVVGVREIAKSKNEKSKLDETFSALVSFLIISTLVVSVVYFVVISVVPRFRESQAMFYLGLTRILISAFSLEWFFQGLENFKFIAIRTICIRVLYIISVFCIINDASDYKLYFFLSLMTNVLNAVINLFASRKFVVMKFSLRGAKRMVSPMFTYGLYSVLNATFSTFNYIFLGFLCTDVQVGYYSTADQLYIIFLSVISAFTTVMLPRMSSLLSNNNKTQFTQALEKSLEGVLTICIPLAIFGVFFAPQIIGIISGPGYEGAIIPLQIMMVLVLINAINQVFITQAAIPLGLDKSITIGTAIAALISIPLNFIMMKYFQAIGCAIVLVISVIFANIYPLYVLFSHKYVPFPLKIFIKKIIQSIPYVVVAIIGMVLSYFTNKFVAFFIAATLFGLYFLITNRYLLLSFRGKNNGVAETDD